ncbi:MAG TPA: hypothetical protein VJO13_15540 [Ktedonobacterales bacterium]|nr:hypothetical protein [Ktedonobacterales bacterium]
MSDLDEQVTDLQRIYPGSKRCEEGGTTFYFIPQLPLPPGCSPTSVDALLCPTPRDSYPSRLYFAERAQTPPLPTPLNWNGSARILERNWYAFSWVEIPALPLVDLVQAYTRALLP